MSARGHAVAVCDNRPYPRRFLRFRGAQFEPYFIALCECGWYGPPRESSDEAFKDAYEHDSNVSQDVQRLIG